MQDLVDCPRCECLVRPGEPVCPFCRANLRSTAASPWWAWTFALTLGMGLVACDDKNDKATASASMPYPDGVTYAGPPSDPYYTPTTGESTGTTTQDSSSAGSTSPVPEDSTTTTGTTTDDSSSSAGTTATDGSSTG
ncbi:hypothetical protein [Nannocystis punicea]|uniref:Uncharacterized protein n=1 Tax=Nannocystis punicea TaxID=2995304 RepID=A0ABY7H3L3_9BACT|nr:hypothetical protein [Nannocystis poenicansa]WAS93855.1 hypothetical protein O0S08_47585 [Nannocystis poenicansa]